MAEDHSTAVDSLELTRQTIENLHDSIREMQSRVDRSRTIVRESQIAIERADECLRVTEPTRRSRIAFLVS